MAYCFPNIDSRRAELGVTKVHMAEQLGISYQALVNKLDGTSEFNSTELRKIHEMWGDSIDDLLAVMEEK